MIAETILALVLLMSHVICADGARVLNVHLRTTTPPPDCFAVMALAKGKNDMRAVYTPCGGSGTTTANLPRLAGWYNEYLNVAANTRFRIEIPKYRVFVEDFVVDSKKRIHCDANLIAESCTVTAWDPNCVMLLISLKTGRRITFTLSYTPCGSVARTDMHTLTPDVSIELPVTKGSVCWLDAHNQYARGIIYMHTWRNGYIECNNQPWGPADNPYPFCINTVCLDDDCKVRKRSCASGSLEC